MGNTLRVYRRLLGEAAAMGDDALKAAGRTVAERVGTRWPDLVDEIEGIAAGARVSADMLLAINARTELLAAAGGECSLVGRVSDGACTVAQNWDWHPDLAASMVVWSVRGDDEHRSFVTLTEAGIVAKIGLSSAGLCCGLNFLRCSADGGLDGLPIHVLLRVLLDRTGTLPEALSLLTGVAVSASSCITLGWADGCDASLVAAELSPGGCRLVWPDGEDPLVHTNHFLLPPPRGRDLEAAEAPSTLLRHRAVARAAREGALEDALCSHDGAPQSVCRHVDPAAPWAEQRATLASVVIEPAARRMRVAVGAPCEATSRAVAVA